MPGDRYVLLGLGRPRAEWFRHVSQWATTAVIPAEFSKCVSVEELRARLASGRMYSAVLVDGALPVIDRDLIDAARSAGSVVLVVDDRRPAADWLVLGAATVLPPQLERAALLDALATHASMIGRPRAEVVDGAEQPLPLDLGGVAAVCGPGGTGASTVAAALAQGLGARHGAAAVVLADLARHGEQAMLHDVRDVVPGIQELVEAHRSGEPGLDEVLAMTFHVVERRYHLLLGLRRARYWSTLRPRAFTAAFVTLRRCFEIVVCDVTADFEGEDESGSADLEERNLMSRTAVHAADVVFAVGQPGVKGVHALVRVLGDLAAAGVPAGRVVPVVNAAPRHPRARAEITAALSALAAPVMGGGHTVAPVFLPARSVEAALRDVVPLPTALAATLATAYDATVARLGRAEDGPEPGPQLVVPGSLGLSSPGEP